jgi:hypothetical protein
MSTPHFVGVHAAAAAALHGGGASFDGPEPPEAVVEALEEAGVEPAPRAPAAGGAVDTDAWGLPEPVGLCLEEARELCDAIRRRIAELR